MLGLQLPDRRLLFAPRHGAAGIQRLADPIEDLPVKAKRATTTVPGSPRCRKQRSFRDDDASTLTGCGPRSGPEREPVPESVPEVPDRLRPMSRDALGRYGHDVMDNAALRVRVGHRQGAGEQVKAVVAHMRLLSTVLAGDLAQRHAHRLTLKVRVPVANLVLRPHETPELGHHRREWQRIETAKGFPGSGKPVRRSSQPNCARSRPASRPRRNQPVACRLPRRRSRTGGPETASPISERGRCFSLATFRRLDEQTWSLQALTARWDCAPKRARDPSGTRQGHTSHRSGPTEDDDALGVQRRGSRSTLVNIDRRKAMKSAQTHR